MKDKLIQDFMKKLDASYEYKTVNERQNIITELYKIAIIKLINEYEQLNTHAVISCVERPYLEVVTIEIDRKYNPKYGDDRKCKCGHPYHRHFDSYEQMEVIGCKYCECDVFEEA